MQQLIALACYAPAEYEPNSSPNRPHKMTNGTYVCESESAFSMYGIASG